MPLKSEPRRSRTKKCRVRFRLHETPPDGALGAPKINLFQDLLLTFFRDPVFFGPGPLIGKKVAPGVKKEHFLDDFFVTEQLFLGP